MAAAVFICALLVSAGCSVGGSSGGGDNCQPNGQGSCVGAHAEAVGRTVNQAGQPVANVTIYFGPVGKSLDFATHAVTDASGHYEDHAVPVGDIVVTVDSAHRIVVGTTSLHVVDGQQVTLNFTVASGT